LHFLREAREAEYRSKYATGGSDGVMLEAIFGRDNGKAKTGLRERQVSEATKDAEVSRRRARLTTLARSLACAFGSWLMGLLARSLLGRAPYSPAFATL